MIGERRIKVKNVSGDEYVATWDGESIPFAKDEVLSLEEGCGNVLIKNSFCNGDFKLVQQFEEDKSKKKCPQCGQVFDVSKSDSGFKAHVALHKAT